MTDHRRQAFAGFQGDIANKTVTHHNVGRAFENIIAFNIAVKIQIAGIGGRSQQFRGFFDVFAAFDGFFANVQEAYRGFFNAVEHRHQGRTHQSKLQKMLWRGIYVGAQIQHRGATTLDIGHGARNRWAINTIHGFQNIARDSHQCACVTSRYRCLSMAVAHLLDGHAHRRVFFAAQSHFHRVVHFDDFRGGHDAGMGMGKRGKRFGQADQQELGTGMKLEKLAARRQGDTGPMVTAHAVHGHGHHWKHP